MVRYHETEEHFEYKMFTIVSLGKIFLILLNVSLLMYCMQSPCFIQRFFIQHIFQYISFFNENIPCGFTQSRILDRKFYSFFANVFTGITRCLIQSIEWSWAWKFTVVCKGTHFMQQILLPKFCSTGVITCRDNIDHCVLWDRSIRQVDNNFLILESLPIYCRSELISDFKKKQNMKPKRWPKVTSVTLGGLLLL